MIPKKTELFNLSCAFLVLFEVIKVAGKLKYDFLLNMDSVNKEIGFGYTTKVVRLSFLSLIVLAR